MVLRGRNALKGTHVPEFGVRDDHADGLGGIHGGAAADGDDGVGPAGAEGRYAVGNVFNGGVGLDAGIYGKWDARFGKQVGDLCRDAELDERGIRADENVTQALLFHKRGDLFDRALAVERYGVENDSV